MTTGSQIPNSSPNETRIHFDEDLKHIIHEYIKKDSFKVRQKDRRKSAILNFYTQLYKAHISKSYESYLSDIKKALDYVAHHPEAKSVISSNLMTWDSFKQEYMNQNRTTLPFVGYGSLMNANDIKRTLPKERDVSQIIAFGGKRLFKYKPPSNNICGQPTPGFELEVASLGFEESKNVNELSSNDLFNGVVFNLHKDEIPYLQEREARYLIKKIPIMRIDAIKQGNYNIEYAYVLVFPHSDGQDLKPHLNYLHIIFKSYCEESPENQHFIRHFCESAYLADGKTNLAEWLFRQVHHYYLIERLMKPL